MKRCPECRRDYYDDTLLYCLDDGTPLLDGPASHLSERPAVAGGLPQSSDFNDEPKTAILSAPLAGRRESPTAILQPPATTGGSDSSEKQSLSARRAAKPLGIRSIAVVRLIGGFFGYRYFGSAGKQIESIAVMPFVNESGNPDVEYLSDGMTETLISSLSNLRNLSVKPRSTVFRYKGKETDAKTIGKDLNVQAILNGRVVERGDQLTLSLELVDVEKDIVLWSEQYIRKQSDLVSLQTEIARDVSSKLKSKLSGVEVAKVEKNYTTNPEAYQLYLKGRFYWNKRTGEALKKSIEYFNQAIDTDPNFALAYAGLADYYVVPANPLPPREKMPKAKAAAMRALELDDTLAEAHATLARTLMIYDWEWAGAEKEFKRAIELNAGYAKAHQWYGGYLDAIGRRDDAITEAKRARELDPLLPIMNFELGMAFYYNRDYDKAIEELQETLALDADFPPANGELSAAYELKGMYDQAVAGFQKGLAASGTNEWYFSKSGLGHVYAVSGKTGEARAVLNELRQLSEREYVPADRIALIYAGLGEKDQAFAWLEKAYEERSFNMAWLKVEPRWDSLRDDPRFKAMLKRMNLPE